MPIKLITGPTSEPLSLVEAKAHLRMDTDDEDSLVLGWIADARNRAEHITRRSLMPQTWELSLDGFPPIIKLPRPPFVGVTTIKYIDPAGAVQTMDDASWIEDEHSEPARLSPLYGESWPEARAQPGAVLVRYTAGYANAASVPEPIKSWMKLHIKALDDHRKSVAQGQPVHALPFVDGLLDAYRVWGE